MASLGENLPPSKDLIVKRSVVKIISKDAQTRAIGTGWIVKKESSKAWIVTNRHVVSNKGEKQPFPNIEVEYYSKPTSGQFRKRSRAKILHLTNSHDWLDMAILQVQDLPADIQPLSLTNDYILINQPIRVIGHPFTLQEWSVLTGEIKAKSKQKLKISAPLAEGSSGSPVLNQNNQVIGVAVGVQLLCDRPSLNNLDLSCGIAFPIDIVKEQLLKWGIY